jgi:hypothetical protein
MKCACGAESNTKVEVGILAKRNEEKGFSQVYQLMRSLR